MFVYYFVVNNASAMSSFFSSDPLPPPLCCTAVISSSAASERSRGHVPISAIFIAIWVDGDDNDRGELGLHNYELVLRPSPLYLFFYFSSSSWSSDP